MRLETNAGNSGEMTIDCQIDGNTGAIVGINASQSVEVTNGIFQWHNGTMLHQYGVARPKNHVSNQLRTATLRLTASTWAVTLVPSEHETPL